VDAGYELDGPVQEDCGVYSPHRPAADRPEPGSARHRLTGGQAARTKRTRASAAVQTRCRASEGKG
jgi:hypothetical protein